VIAHHERRPVPAGDDSRRAAARTGACRGTPDHSRARPPHRHPPRHPAGRA
jgi:hypothetical protein